MPPGAAEGEGRGLPVALEGVSRVFQAPGQEGVHALAGVDLRIGAGDFVALVGPSGCGKSTLLRIVAGLERPDAGRLRVGGAGAGARLRPGDLAFVFQDAQLLPWRDVLGNVRLPLELGGQAPAARRGAARAAIERVGLGEAAGRYPAQLSGGMRMRVSLARALVTQPRLLLLDEPFGALDEITRHALQEQLRRLWREGDLTVLFVTHSIAEATFLAERVVVLTPRPARVVLEHAVALPDARDAALRTEATFAAEMRLLQQALARGGVDA